MAVSFKRFFNFVAFIALVIIGLALLLGIIGIEGLSGPMLQIAEILAYIIVAFYAFLYAWKSGADQKGKWSKRQLVHLGIWLAATILIVVCVILK